MTTKLQAALEKEMSLWPTRTEEGRSISAAEPMRWISVLSPFNWSLFWSTQTFTSEMQASIVSQSESFRRKIQFVQFSVIHKYIMRDRVVTDYIRKRLSIKNEENRSQDGTLGDPSSQKWRRGFYFIQSYYLCPKFADDTELYKSNSPSEALTLSRSIEACISDIKVWVV